MSKYTDQFKLAVGEQYLAGGMGYKAVAHSHNILYSTVRKWVNLYRAHGMDGLPKKFSHYSAEFRLSVLRRMWDDELSYSQVAAAFNIRNAGCISQWERCYHSGGLDALAPRKRGGPKKMPIIPSSEPPESNEEMSPGRPCRRPISAGGHRPFTLPDIPFDMLQRFLGKQQRLVEGGSGCSGTVAAQDSSCKRGMTRDRSTALAIRFTQPAPTR